MKNVRIVMTALLLAGCDAEPSMDGVPDGGLTSNQPGKHLHTLVVGGMERDVIVYVPEQARGATPVPAVLMFHGTSGDGEKFYNISGWREQSDAEGLISVYPSGLTYCLKEDENHDGDFDDPGEQKVTTKWADGKLSNPLVMPLCTAAELAALPAGQRALVDHPLADDVAFVQAILDLLAQGYAVDARRVYATGFSNGANFTSRLALELSDRLAAVAVSSGALQLPPVLATRSVKVMLTFGSQDNFVVDDLGLPELPLVEDLFVQVPAIRERGVDPMLAMLGLGDPFTYSERTVAGTKISDWVWSSATQGFEVLCLDDQTHQYPNGTNHPVVLADLLWDFFRSEALP